MVYWNSPCHQLGHLRDGCGHFKCHQNICSWYCQIPCFVKTKKSIKANGMDIQTSWVRIQVVTRLLHMPCRRAWDCPRPLKKAENSVLFFSKYTQCNSPRKRNFLMFASRWRHTSRWYHIPRVYLNASQLGWCATIGHQPIRTPVRKTTEAVYRSMRGASWDVKQASNLGKYWINYNDLCNLTTLSVNGYCLPRGVGYLAIHRACHLMIITGTITMVPYIVCMM